MQIPAINKPVTVQHLIELCRWHEKWDILAKLQRISQDEIFSSDGCSMWPDEFKGLSIYEACFWHDVRYWLGGSDAERAIADAYLVIDVAKAGLPKIARIMFGGVSVGGADTILNTEFEWGYGGFA